MNKRSLMLSAAAAALLSSPAMAATTIATTVTSTQKTSSTGDLTISPGGVITFKSQTDPLINIDANAIVINNGNLTSTDSTNQTAVLINATGLTGSYTQNGNMDLSGTGVSKKGLFLSGASTFTGNITFASTSVVNIVGDQSVGVLTDAQSTLNGDISLGGQFTVSQSSVSNTTASNVLAMALPGVINGNVGVISGSTIGAVGANAVAIAITGPLHACVVAGCTSIGTFKNEGSIVSTGILNRSATATNPEGGSTVIIAGNLDGGFLNNGLTSSGDAVNHAGTISGNGSPISSPGSVILVGSSTNSVTLGAVTGDFNGTYGFINRGGIVAAPVDANQFTRAVVLQGGSATTPTNIKGGVFSSGSITANTTSTTGGNGVTATAIEVDNYITIPEIRASGQSFVQGANRGTIAANISGPLGGTAAAILINGTTGTSVPLITVEQNATVSANAQVVDPSATVPTGFILNAIAIQDSSNSLATLLNQGTISATATTLTNGFTSTARAVMAQNNTTALNFTNSGTVTGDVLFGSGSDTYTIQGANQNAIARHTGTIDFGLSNANGGTGDTLHVAQFSNVAGTIKATGTLDVAVDPTGILTVQNIGTTVATRNFAVAGGNGAGAGTVNVTVSSGVGTGGVIQSNVVTFGSGANLNVQYGSFIPLTGTSTNFVLLSANKGQLGISDADVARYSASVGGSTTLPFLFRTAGIAKDLSDPSRDKLVLTVTPKTQAELNLTGYGAATFAQANIAAGVDSTLGSALVQGVTAANVQSAYDAFAPDVTGGTRAIAVALTDQASGQVAARQRTLRMFAKNPGELTLWGTEFAQYISSPARTGGAVATNGTITAPGTVNGFKD
ncbi:MAG: hypothetical protein JO167_03990, partial [Alphaproteobacteria bacterium]|nr:hypothetical protein [Alphaproteobacteria bacterium]